MARVNNLSNFLTDVASAIKTKNALILNKKKEWEK